MTDYERKIEILKSYRENADRIVFLNNQIAGVKGIKYTLEPVGDKAPRTINDYIEEKIEVEQKLRRIEDAIDVIPNKRARLILAYKYLQYRNFDWIAEQLGFSTKQISRLHKAGIFEIIL